MPIYLLKFFPLESQAKLMIEEKMLSTYCKGEKKIVSGCLLTSVEKPLQ